jgi:hypothetical protein
MLLDFVLFQQYMATGTNHEAPHCAIVHKSDLLTYVAVPFLRRCQLCSHSRASHHFMEPDNSLLINAGPKKTKKNVNSLNFPVIFMQATNQPIFLPQIRGFRRLARVRAAVPQISRSSLSLHSPSSYFSFFPRRVFLSHYFLESLIWHGGIIWDAAGNLARDIGDGGALTGDVTSHTAESQEPRKKRLIRQSEEEILADLMGELWRSDKKWHNLKPDSFLLTSRPWTQQRDM